MSGTEARFQNATAPGEASQYGALLGSGGFASIPSRDNCGQQGLTGTGVLNLTYFKAPKNFHSVSVKMYSGSTAAAATPTLIRHGLWLVDPLTGALTAQAAATPNDTTLFAPTTNIGYSKNWTTAYDFIKGQWYAHGILIVSAAALPTVFGVAGANNFIVNAVLPRISAVVGSQADLPATVAAGSLTASGTGRYYVEFN